MADDSFEPAVKEQTSENPKAKCNLPDIWSLPTERILACTCTCFVKDADEEQEIERGYYEAIVASLKEKLKSYNYTDCKEYQEYAIVSCILLVKNEGLNAVKRAIEKVRSLTYDKKIDSYFETFYKESIVRNYAHGSKEDAWNWFLASVTRNNLEDKALVRIEQRIQTFENIHDIMVAQEQGKVDENLFIRTPFVPMPKRPAELDSETNRMDLVFMQTWVLNMMLAMVSANKKNKRIFNLKIDFSKFAMTAIIDYCCISSFFSLNWRMKSEAIDHVIDKNNLNQALHSLHKAFDPDKIAIEQKLTIDKFDQFEEMYAILLGCLVNPLEPLKEKCSLLFYWINNLGTYINRLKSSHPAFYTECFIRSQIKLNQVKDTNVQDSIHILKSYALTLGEEWRKSMPAQDSFRQHSDSNSEKKETRPKFCLLQYFMLEILLKILMKVGKHFKPPEAADQQDSEIEQDDTSSPISSLSTSKDEN
ncbi:hypothetical protein Ciccas_011419 [Cichlidogyrus casuarinus]|uniref:Uncharacterized protein n=1 Tax=Cichlidogyrus casuarinus TaxID=1844966 RepID=A0ABD2PRA9_9PLAT